jgi:hypothetical protein epulo_00670
MSNKNGIKVFAPFVAPEGTPVAYASDIAGCNRIVATKADLLTIPTSLLEVGMSVFVQDEAKDYRLANKSEVPVASDWTSAAPTAADIKVAEDKTLADVLITKEEVATKIADATNAAGETYQTKADALAAKTALEESIHAVSTAGLSEETKQDIQAAKDAAATLAGFQQTLDQTKTELTQKVEEAKQAALTQEDKTAIASIADVKSTAEAAKAKAEELEPKVTEAKEAVDGLKTKVEALPDSDAIDAKITTAKEAINNSIDLVKDSVAALKTVVQGSEDGATKGLDAKITEAKEEAANNLAAAKQALEHSIEQAATAGLPEETKQDIQAAKEAATKLTEITSKVNDAVSKATDADTKVGTLETKVTALESFKTDAEPKLAAVDTVKEAVDTLKDTTVPAIADRVTTLEGKAAPTDFTEGQKTKLDEILTGKHFANADDIDNAKSELKNELATQESVNQLANQTLTAAQGKVTEAKEELEGKITELGTKVDAIHVPDTSTLATKEELNSVKEKVAPHMVKLIEDIIFIKTSDGSKHIFIKADTNSYPVSDQKEDVVLLEGNSSTEIKASDYNSYTGYVRFAANDISASANLKLKINTPDEVYIQDIGALYSIAEFTAIENASPTLVVFEKSDKDSNETNKKYIKPVALNKDTGDYTFIIDLKSGVGNPTNICVGFTNAETNNISDSCKEFAQLPKAVSINGQFGMFKTTAEIDTFRAFKMNVADGSYDAFRTPTSSFPNDFKYYELKNPLTPDGQNDTYIVTYHRPFNI